ncbi:Acetyltransferase (GNAT) family protein [Sulfitobacter brevis]|uniref:Acetyltransferase (GNAT) family protein n=1 Tax=Sulfitobacter brevis TaxID=74348 RepID=A0A1I2HE26_9RHOB|nr:GNAT family N-acetyltransferase [Sulfitobacter brevis]SFF26801.1 Acetyltransferase (GNAT) family protein [Sulfitobacter brevis]
MSEHPFSASPEIRKLWRHDKPDVAEHLLRLDQHTRRSRFGAVVKDNFIKHYAEGIIAFDTVVFGAFFDGQLRAIGELRGTPRSWPRHAELALSVEPGWQGKRIGSALFSRLIEASQNRGIRSLHVLFLSENKMMQSIARRYHPETNFNGGQIEAALEPPWATPMSFAREMVADANARIRRCLLVAT